MKLSKIMNVIELFSGIGGMHYSLKEAGIDCNVVAAVDINTSANEVYKHNFPGTPVYQRNIQSFSSDEINKFNPDVLTMSPPCQPFTRVGLKKDSGDPRTDALIHVIKLLPNLTLNLKYIILENVKGFEVSRTRDMLIKALKECHFKFQEFLLNPADYLIPSSRLRYYLIAKRESSNFQFLHELAHKIPFTPEKIISVQKEKNPFVECLGVDNQANTQFKMHSLSKILETDSNLTEYIIAKKVLLKYASLFDITFPFSRRSCCFTKAYGRYAEGTGSVLCPITVEEVANAHLIKMKMLMQSNEDKKKVNEELANILEELGLRYFTPREIARLMCFPETFTWPKHFSSQQMYRLLGNSINVHMVTLLLILLMEEENGTTNTK